MRILWFNHRDIRHPLAGGAERTIHEVGKRLAMRGHEVHLASVNPGNLPPDEVIDGVMIHRASGNIVAHLLVPFMIRKVKPDFIVDSLAHVVPWFSPFFTRAKVIVFFFHLHARSLPGQVSTPTARILTLLERIYPLIYSRNTFVTELSTGVEDLTNLGISPSHIIKIPLGVDTKLFKPCRKTNEPSLIYFGGMKDYKRPWLALEVLKMFPRSNGVTLIIVGDGKILEKMREMSNNYGLDKHVRFTGRIPDGELADLVAASWANLHFSTAEGFGLSILEAAAAGTPTVALDVPGVSEIVNGFGLGKTVGNLGEFPNALNDILNGNRSWSEMVNASASSFSWTKCSEKWESILVGDTPFAP